MFTHLTRVSSALSRAFADQKLERLAVLKGTSSSDLWVDLARTGTLLRRFISAARQILRKLSMTRIVRSEN